MSKKTQTTQEMETKSATDVESEFVKERRQALAALRMKSSMYACRELWVPGEDAVVALQIEKWEHYLYPTRKACQAAINSTNPISQNWKPMRVLIIAGEEVDDG